MSNVMCCVSFHQPIKINQNCIPVLSDYFLVGFDSIHYIGNTSVDSIQTKISIKTFYIFLSQL